MSSPSTREVETGRFPCVSRPGLDENDFVIKREEKGKRERERKRDRERERWTQALCLLGIYGF